MIGLGIGLGSQISMRHRQGVSAPPDPTALGALYWWDASDGLMQDGSVVTWTDRVSGVMLTNADASNGVQFKSPIKIVNIDHNFRPALLSRLGAVHGAVTPMAQARRLSLFIVARAGNDQYYRLFAGVNSDLVHGAGRWSVNTRDMAIYASNKNAIFNNSPPNTNTDTFLYEWAMGPSRTLSDIKVYREGVLSSLKATTDGTKVLYSDFGEVVIGATPAGTTALNFSTAEIEHVIVIDVADTAMREDVLAWWEWRKTVQDTKAIPPASIVLQYGQSNTVGADTNAATVFARHGNRSFGNGPESWTADADGSGGVVRTTSQALKERTYESGMAHGLDRLVDRKLSVLGSMDWRDLSKHYFAIHPGVSGHSIEQLSAAPDWARVLLDIAGAKDQAGQGATFDWIWWVQGFSNATDARGTYDAKLVSMFANIKTAAQVEFPIAAPKTIIGQHCTSRTNAGFPSVSLSQLSVADADASVYIMPLYQLPWINGTHLSTLGQQLKGETFAKVMMDVETGTYQPVRLALASWTDTQITLSVSGGTGDYVFDTTNISGAPNMGFDVWSSDDTTLQDIISGVSITGSTITISLSAPAIAGSRLGYGWGRAAMAQPKNAPYALGNLRDDDDRTALVGGVSYPLYNWCLISDIAKP